jgi:bifunctional DNA-binding transcriptional regulator/antitoxin component of YhaV-PrlF toxin-antitoxin module
MVRVTSMKIELKANQQGQIYLPKLLRDQWGNEYVLIPNAQGGYIYPKGVRAKDALKSLEVVRQDLAHRAELEESKSQARGQT